MTVYLLKEQYADFTVNGTKEEDRYDQSQRQKRDKWPLGAQSAVWPETQGASRGVPICVPSPEEEENTPLLELYEVISVRLKIKQEECSLQLERDETTLLR